MRKQSKESTRLKSRGCSLQLLIISFSGSEHAHLWQWLPQAHPVRAGLVTVGVRAQVSQIGLLPL